MASTMPRAAVGDAPWKTHTVFNQAPPLEGVDVFESNTPLVEATEREGAGWVRERASDLGRLIGGAPQQEWGRLANENKPVLHTFDRVGNRIDEVEFHPAWHQLMQMGVANELHSLPWTSEEAAPHTARAALYVTAMQAEAGFCCPITMTFAVIPALRAQPELAAEWEPLLMSTSYDPRLVPAGEKGSAICGHGDDREAGRLRRARQHDRRTRAERRWRRRRVRDRRPQVVLLGADVRPVPRARAGRGGPLVLLDAADPARRLAQRVSHPAPEGQARQPLERLEGGRVPRRLGAHGRRARPRRADDHRDGRAHAPGLRDRRRRRDAQRRRLGHSARRSPQRLRQDADRPAADAQRARRPLHRVRGHDRTGDAPGPCLRRSAGRRRRRRERDRRAAVQAPGDGRRQVLDAASAPPTTPSSRSSASAAPATSRSPACRACTARRRWPRSGRARAT